MAMSTNDPAAPPAIQKYSPVYVPPWRAISTGLVALDLAGLCRNPETVRPSTTALSCGMLILAASKLFVDRGQRCGDRRRPPPERSPDTPLDPGDLRQEV